MPILIILITVGYKHFVFIRQYHNLFRKTLSRLYIYYMLSTKTIAGCLAAAAGHGQSGPRRHRRRNHGVRTAGVHQEAHAAAVDHAQRAEMSARPHRQHRRAARAQRFIEQQARREGVRDLRQAGLVKIKAGLTTLEEVISVTNE